MHEQGQMLLCPPLCKPITQMMHLAPHGCSGCTQSSAGALSILALRTSCRSTPEHSDPLHPAALQNVRRYQSLATGQELLESQILDSLPEHLNAEIVLQTITDVSQAIAWIASTFMYVRVGRVGGAAPLPLLAMPPLFACKYVPNNSIPTSAAAAAVPAVDVP